MTWLVIILLFLILVFIYLLFAPFYLEIDSEKSLMRIRFHQLSSARVLIRDSALVIDLRVAGWRKRIDPLAEKKKKEKTIEAKQKNKLRKFSLRKGEAILKTFKVNQCYFNLDFDDVQWNGILFPLFFWMSRFTGKDFRINFLRENEMKLQIENNIARILWAFIFK